MFKVFISFPDIFLFQSSVKVSSPSTVKDLYQFLTRSGRIGEDLQSQTYVTNHGLCTSLEDELVNNEIYRFNFKLLGGKGGFGSMLRALGSQIEKTTNNEACRDLSGRRMRDVNNETKMMEWVKNKAEKDKQKEKDKIEKLERQMQRPKHFFNDPEYEKSLEATSDSVEDALKSGLKAKKRVSNDSVPHSSAATAKKSRLWLGVDDISESSDSESDEESSTSHQPDSVLKTADTGESSSNCKDKQPDESSSVEK